MATSITKFYYIHWEQVEMFADAVEASANDKNTSCSVNVTYLQGCRWDIKFMEKGESECRQRIILSC